MEKKRDDDISLPDISEAKGPAKKLGLSKVVYALGLSARDSLATFVAATVALFPLMLWGQEKDGIIKKASQIPEKIHQKWNSALGERSGKYGKAFALSVGLATIIGYVAHLPGLIRGPKKIRDAEEMYNVEVETNRQQSKEISSLTDTVKRQGIELTEVKKQNASFAERVKTPEPSPNTLSI